MTGGPASRRPLASRDRAWAQRAARWLAGTQITPNQISQASMVFAGIGGVLFATSAGLDGIARGAELLLAALMCQARLLCNLFDGMVAVEGGKSAPDGGFWNEAPDRVSDVMLFVGAGIGAGAPVLGWAAAAMALATAYVRELGRAEGLAPDFCGPMAKPQRMAVLTGAGVLAAVEPLVVDSPHVLSAALWIVAVGAGATAFRRAARMIAAMRAG